MATPTAPPTVPAPEFHKATFSSKDVPITAVTVFCKDKAEVTRVINLSTSSGVGPHEVSSTGARRFRCWKADSEGFHLAARGASSKPADSSSN